MPPDTGVEDQSGAGHGARSGDGGFGGDEGGIAVLQQAPHALDQVPFGESLEMRSDAGAEFQRGEGDDGRELRPGVAENPVDLGDALFRSAVSLDEHRPGSPPVRRREVLREELPVQLRRSLQPLVVEPRRVPHVEVGVDEVGGPAHLTGPTVRTPIVSRRFAYGLTSPLAITIATSGWQAAS